MLCLFSVEKNQYNCLELHVRTSVCIWAHKLMLLADRWSSVFADLSHEFPSFSEDFWQPMFSRLYQKAHAFPALWSWLFPFLHSLSAFIWWNHRINFLLASSCAVQSLFTALTEFLYLVLDTNCLHEVLYPSLWGSLRLNNWHAPFLKH